MLGIRQTLKKIPETTNLATKAALNTKATETENKISDTTGFIDFNRLAKISFDAKLKKYEKSLASKSPGHTALDIAYKSREKIKKT